MVVGGQLQLPHVDPCRQGENLPTDDSGKQGEVGILSDAETKLLPVAAGGGREVEAGGGREVEAGCDREVEAGDGREVPAGNRVAAGSLKVAAAAG